MLSNPHTVQFSSARRGTFYLNKEKMPPTLLCTDQGNIVSWEVYKMAGPISGYSSLESRHWSSDVKSGTERSKYRHPPTTHYALSGYKWTDQQRQPNNVTSRFRIILFNKRISHTFLCSFKIYRTWDKNGRQTSYFFRQIRILRWKSRIGIELPFLHRDDFRVH